LLYSRTCHGLFAKTETLGLTDCRTPGENQQENQRIQPHFDHDRLAYKAQAIAPLLATTGKMICSHARPSELPAYLIKQHPAL
jgi:hypothetical protein